MNQFRGLVPGLVYTPEYLTQAEQAALAAAVDAQPWRSDLKRRVQHYGYRYDYKSRSIDRDMYLGALPEWAGALAGRLLADGFTHVRPDQLIVNEYLPGQGISAHVDCIPCFGDAIISISLGSTCLMEFTHVRSHERVIVLLRPGSMVAMQGQARTMWTHGIPARKSDQFDGTVYPRARRLSLTFRQVLTAS
jgi:alkylated DNA repair dioxygenase AlkB